MNNQNSQTGQESPPLWRFIGLDHYHRPSEPTREAVRKGLLGIWDKFRKPPPPQEPTSLQISLEDLPGNLLQEVAPPPDWQEAVPALHETIQDWWTGGPRGSSRLIVGSPHSGTSEILEYWASTYECPVLPSPPADQLLTLGNKWLEQIDRAPDRIWVIPRLEHFYLRHSQGLTLLRRLLEKTLSLPGRVLLAVDSWAWAYLSKALHIDALMPQPLVLEAFDQEKLGRWLRGLAGTTPGRNFVFRQADNGKLVLPPPQEDHEAGPGEDVGFDPGSDPGTPPVSDFLVRLAAYSRGNPGVAWAIWRYSLRSASDAEVKEKAREAAEDDGAYRTIWVKPWSQLDFPTLTGVDKRSQEFFILQSLLLHDGLSSQLLAKISPFPESQTRRSLQFLRAKGVVETDQETWRVTAPAYPSVRFFLQGEGYLEDVL